MEDGRCSQAPEKRDCLKNIKLLPSVAISRFALQRYEFLKEKA